REDEGDQHEDEGDQHEDEGDQHEDEGDQHEDGRTKEWTGQSVMCSRAAPDGWRRMRTVDVFSRVLKTTSDCRIRHVSLSRYCGRVCCRNVREMSPRHSELKFYCY
ncbi:hypothetical protein LSAT2_027993, partial [Lamellibrachia satsuma]